QPSGLYRPSPPQAFFHSPCAALRVGPLCRHASTSRSATRSPDCFPTPASSSATCCDIPSKANSFGSHQRHGVCGVQSSHVAVTTGTVCPPHSRACLGNATHVKGSFTLIYGTPELAIAGPRFGSKIRLLLLGAK